MAGFLSRVAGIFKSNAHAVLDRLEDPEKLIEQTVRDMQQQLGQAKTAVASAIASERRLKKELDENARRSEMWEQKAMQALTAGNEELAKKALERKKEHDDIVGSLKPQWDTAQQTADKLKTQLRSLDGKIEQARRKRNTIIARHKAAQAQQKIQSTLSTCSNTSAFDTFARMEEKVSELEANASAQEELADEFSGDTLEKEFSTLEDQSVDGDLAALKAKMAQ